MPLLNEAAFGIYSDVNRQRRVAAAASLFSDGMSLVDSWLLLFSSFGP